jgi:hypothetical protein
MYKNLEQALIVNHHFESFYDRFPKTKAWVDLFIQQKTLRQGLKKKLCTYLSDEFIAAYPKHVTTQEGIVVWFNANSESLDVEKDQDLIWGAILYSFICGFELYNTGVVCTVPEVGRRRCDDAF